MFYDDIAALNYLILVNWLCWLLTCLQNLNYITTFLIYNALSRDKTNEEFFKIRSLAGYELIALYDLI